ncbi:hypothetical protein GY45DRAFT_1302015 [Cubamyces sp. BRFM 1775]|nr:hypothetical protein GY45DRAFT_1302015 [Cubamyces sp. BRFM 1775]
MQATIDSQGLKHWTRALTCLSKFGDELTIIATPETFALSATNQSMSAYGRFKYARSFFSRYRVAVPQPPAPGPLDDLEFAEVPPITGQIVIKPLLQILKHKTIEKSCEKCEFVISDGASQEPRLAEDIEGVDGDDRDTLESRLTIRLHCKHGVVKTHRLPLNAAHNLMSPTMPDAEMESHLTVGPKALRSMLEHFPFGKGAKTDPQLIWNFNESEVQLRSLESAVDAKGRVNLTTELTISAEEFDEYDLRETPMTIAFHLKEFNATIAFAEASQLSLEIRFTDPSAPLYIDVGGDLADTLFVIAASQLQSVSPHNSQTRRANGNNTNNASHANARKRPLEEDTHQRNAHAVDPARERTRARSGNANRPQYNNGDDQWGAAPPSPPRVGYAYASQQSQRERILGNGKGKEREKEPLFLPGSQLSQLPPAAEAAIIESGLGIENMTAEEFEAMLEGDAEEVEFGTGPPRRTQQEEEDGGEGDAGGGQEEWQMEEDEVDYRYGQRQEDSFELVDDVEMEPTQNDGGTKVCAIILECTRSSGR